MCEERVNAGGSESAMPGGAQGTPSGAGVCVVWTVMRSERVRGSLGLIRARRVCCAWWASNSHL